MCVICYSFIDKTLLKKPLLKLVYDKYLLKEKYYSYTIYRPNSLKIRDTIIQHTTNKMINAILNTYIITSVFYNVT